MNSTMFAQNAMEWPNEQVLEFIELYQGEEALWNSSNKFHKNRNVLADSWERIRRSFSVEDVTVADLKRKKESLMTAYRNHLNKRKRSIKSGAGADEIYQTNWFAYQAMDSFLGQNYECKPTTDTEPGGIHQEEESAETTNEETAQPQQQTHQRPTGQQQIQRKNKKTFESPLELQLVQKQMDNAFEVMTQATKRKEDLDEADHFCHMLAKKLKKMDDARRDKVMYDIHALLYNSNYQAADANCTLYSSDSPSVFSEASSQSQYVFNEPSPHSQYISNDQIQGCSQYIVNRGASTSSAQTLTPLVSNSSLYPASKQIKVLSQNIVQKAFQLINDDEGQQ